MKKSISDSKIQFYIDWLHRHPAKKTITYQAKQRIGRNDKCFCGSNLKFKHCCWNKYINELIDKFSGESPELSEYLKKETVQMNKKYRRLTNDK